MPLKALFVDIDGTILNSKGTMDRPTFDALASCSANGYIICVATARSGRIVFRKQDILWDHPFLLDRGIFYNGGSIFDRIHHYYQHIAIPGYLVYEITDSINKNDPRLQIALQHDNEYHSFKQNVTDDDIISWGFSRNELLDFKVASSKPTTKIMIYDGANFQNIQTDMSSLYQELINKFSLKTNITLADSRRSIYITSKYASKMYGIFRILELYNINSSEVAVFGDDTSDLEMFEIFRYRIAMGNAIEVIKAKASYVTLSNDEFGVAFALKNYLKIIK